MAAFSTVGRTGSVHNLIMNIEPHMKHAFGLLVASACILASCSGLNETDFEEKTVFEEGELVERVIFEAPVIHSLGEDGETRASLQEVDESINFCWEATDTVGIYPEKGAQVYFEMLDGIGSNIAEFDGGGWALRKESTYYCYFPFVCDMKLSRNSIPVSFSGQEQTGVSNYTGVRFFLAAKGTSSSSGSLLFHFEMLNTIIRVKAIGLPAGTYSKLSLTTDEPLFVQQGTFGLEDRSITGKTFSNTLELSLKDFTLEETSTAENPVQFYLTSAPVDLKGHTLTIQVQSADGHVYQCEKNPSYSYDAGEYGRMTCQMVETDDAVVKYAKASSVSVGGTYLIVSATDDKLFKGATDGSSVDVAPANNVITDTDGSLAAYEFTVENNGSNFFLRFNDGKYLICDYSSSGNTNTGIIYVDTQAQVTSPFTVTTGDNGAFFFSTFESNKNQILYYKTSSGSFKLGESGKDSGVHLYLKEGKQDRGLSFNPQTVTCTLGGIPEKPVLSGNYTAKAVTYSSGNNGVAMVDADGNVTPVAAGTTTITATVAADEQYLDGSASYTLTVLDNLPATDYTKVSRLILGGTYLIVDANDSKLFKGATDGSAVNVSPVNGVITDIGGTLTSFEFTLEDRESNYYLKYSDGKYLICDYSSSGNTNTGIRYVNTQAQVTSPFTVTTGDNGAFFFSTFESNKNQILYYKTSSSYFKLGESGKDSGVHLYLKEGTGGSPAKQMQTLSFTDQIITWILEHGHETGQSYPFPQTVSGNQTNVTYSSSEPDVAKIEGERIKIISSGSTIITATAEETDDFYTATATYTLRILNAPSGELVNLGTFNLENKALHDYLDEAESKYTDTNDTGDDKISVMSTYATGSAYATIDRKDCPNPVTITWTYPASNSTVVSIYENEAMANPVWTQNATANAISADVYNLIPGRKYYYTITEDDIVWERGYFNTTGRRRMIKVSDIERKGHANNCRDLGGLEVTDKGKKKTIKYGYLFRGSNMDKTSTDEQSILLDFMNVGMDIDLRYGTTSYLSTDDGSSNCYRPLPSTVSYINPGFDNFTHLTTADKVRAVVSAIIGTATSGKATYFHCWVGADRTGYFAMLIEGLLGVSEKDCSIDYELTSFSDAVGLRYRTGYNDHYFVQGIAFLRGQTGSTFQEKIENYLTTPAPEGPGISQTDIDEFKSLVLE